MSLNTTNISELEKALRDSFPNSQTLTPLTDISKAEPQYTEEIINSYTNKVPATRSRTSAQQNSTAGLLSNLSGLQTTNNVKLDILNDNIVRLTNKLDILINTQNKQTEILADMYKHMLVSNQESSTPRSTSLTPKISQSTLKDFGFINALDVMSKLIENLLSLCKKELVKKSRNYMANRDINTNILTTAIKVVTKHHMKINGESLTPITMPLPKSTAVLHIASRIGTSHGIIPVMTPISFRDLLCDSVSNTFITLMRDIIDRLKVIRPLIPYYEADILEAIEFPYFDKDGELIYNVSMINPRRERKDETRVQDAPVRKREEIGAMLAKGVSLRSSLAAVLKDN